VILEGESLVNDATALVALQFAIGRPRYRHFSPAYAGGRFVWAAAGGIGIGLLVGVAMRWVQSHLNDPPIQITFSLLTPFIAYLSADRCMPLASWRQLPPHFSLAGIPADDERADSPPSLCVLGNDRVPSSTGSFSSSSVCNFQHPACVESRIAHWRVYECDRNLHHGNFSPFSRG